MWAQLPLAAGNSYSISCLALAATAVLTSSAQVPSAEGGGFWNRGWDDDFSSLPLHRIPEKPGPICLGWARRCFCNVSRNASVREEQRD